MSATKTKQTSFTNPIDRSKEVLKRCANQYDPDHVLIAVSGGTDSVVAADVFCRFGPEYGLDPDAIIHYNTGTAVPQTRLVAQTIAKIHGLDFVSETYRKQEHSLAHRILANGWPGGYAGSPATGGHGLEWANRKNKVGREIYMQFDGFQVWVSGARKLESKKRQGNVPDSGIENDTEQPRRAWCAIIGGWTSAEKQAYIKKRGLPVSETYLVLGFSGECTACSFDEKGLLTDLDILCPELSYAIRSLTVWLYQRARRGDVDIDPKQLCWGWQPGESFAHIDDTETPTSQAMVGCSEGSCANRNRPDWIMSLPDEQIISREDVIHYWKSSELPRRFPV